MGNYISCALSVHGGRLSRRAAKVIFPTGETRHFCEPTAAAELMLETPNFFLVNTKSLQIGRRLSALNADAKLDTASVYVMFPMKRLNSVVSAADMGSLFLAAKRNASFGNTRISPECGSESPETAAAAVGVPKLKLGDIEEFSSPEFKHMLSMCRSKKPLLETIAEEPVCSR